VETVARVSNKNYLVRFKEASIAPLLVKAARVEFQGEHIAFLLSKGELSALFLFDTVSDWSEMHDQG
jgi:hypothetical protein